MHDQATGVHRPLQATLLWLESLDSPSPDPHVVVSLDHCILDSSDLNAIRDAISKWTGAESQNCLITLTHTHGSGWMSRSRSHLPGGEHIGPYLDDLVMRVADLAVQVQDRVQEGTIVYGTGRCNLAAHRDFQDPQLNRFVCGFNPNGAADDTLVLARIDDPHGQTVATVVNYACHPTTLSWDNTLISPDWIGAMRQTIESAFGGTCLFLQGASGDLGPRHGFVGDTEVADRNGRIVGYAALSALEGMPPAGTEYRYTGAVTSGTSIGTWCHEPLDAETLNRHRTYRWDRFVVELPYRHDLPTVMQSHTEREYWQEKETQARHHGDEITVRDCRAQVEQRTRQLARLDALVPGVAYPLEVQVGAIGDAIWLFLPGELYQVFQTTLRHRFAPRPVLIATLTNGWQPGYIPPAHAFGYGIYQEVIAATGAGCLEILIESITRRIHELQL